MAGDIIGLKFWYDNSHTIESRNPQYQTINTVRTAQAQRRECLQVSICLHENH